MVVCAHADGSRNSILLHATNRLGNKIDIIMQYIEKFRTETALIGCYTESKAFIVWSMGLYLDVQDLEQLASDNLTDKFDDHGIDFLRYDEESGILLLAQGYYTTKDKINPPSSKAADLNTSCAWLLNGDIDKFHPTIRDNIKEARAAVEEGNVQKIMLIYLHNCGESKEVTDELKTTKDNLAARLAELSIDINAVQLGNESLERLYMNHSANIIVTENVNCPFEIQYTESSEKWTASVLTVSGQWLRELYLTYSGDLFSANYRGFLGYSRQRINTGIRSTAERTPNNFWAYNNGITLLTTKIEEIHGKITLNGISIINGAQTTGSLGVVPTNVDLSDTKILARIIECSDTDTINAIVKYNNTQNKITAWDSFSNDPVQKQIQDEFRMLKYDYNIKRGFSNRDSLLSVESSIQPLLAISGKYKDANRSKTYLFESRSLYSEAFEKRGARNILFACSLNLCLQSIKSDIKEMIENGLANDSDKKLHGILTVIKYKYYIMAIVATSIKKLSTTLTETSRISFMPEYAQGDSRRVEYLSNVLKPFCNMILPHIANVLGEDCYTSFNDTTTLESISATVVTGLSSLRRISREVDNTINQISTVLCNG